MRVHVLSLALMLAAALSTAAFGQGAPRIVVGDNPSLSGAPLYVALEKGYYREAGIDVQLEMSGTSSDMAVPNNSLPRRFSDHERDGVAAHRAAGSAAAGTGADRDHPNIALR